MVAAIYCSVLLGHCSALLGTCIFKWCTYIYVPAILQAKSIGFYYSLPLGLPDYTSFMLLPNLAPVMVSRIMLSWSKFEIRITKDASM